MKYIILILIAIMLIACSNKKQTFTAEDYDFSKGLPPPEAVVESTWDSAYDHPKPDLPPEIDNEVNYFSPGSYTFNYVYDVRNQNLKSYANADAEYDCTIVLHPEGQISILEEGEAPSPNNTLKVAKSGPIEIGHSNTFYRYDAYHSLGNLFSFGELEWVDVVLYYIKGDLVGIRVDKYIYTHDRVSLKLIEEDNHPPADRVTDENQYKVKKGDTLAKIARKFMMSIEELKRKNNLNSDLIYPGDLLTI